jgi:hypothetical protein
MKFTTTAGKQFSFLIGPPYEGDKQVISLYDQTETKFQPHGQMMSSYYIETFLSIEEGGGLNLHGGVPGWVLSAEDVSFIKGQLLEEQN